MKSKALWTLVALSGLFSLTNSLKAQGSTFTNTTLSVGNGPEVSVADVNADGRLDLIVGSYNTNTLTLLTNNGSGFWLYATLTVGPNPGGTIAADLNGDGRLDFVTANNGANTLTLLTNNGSAGFGFSATLTAGNSPQAVSAVDINGDGKLDLICANFTSPGTLTVFTNNGRCVFGLNDTLTVGIHPVWLTVADVNGDGNVDLITADYGANTLTVLTNSGKARFGFNATLPAGSHPNWVIAADINGDARLDLICANNGANSLTTFTNNGSGNFRLSATLTVGSGPFSLTAADVNGDGKLDLICANSGSWPTLSGNTLTILTNDGSGTFGLSATLTVGKGPAWVTSADMNADGKPDLIVGNFADNTVTVLMNTSTFPLPSNIPMLTIARQGRDVRVAWPAFSPGWLLQECRSLTNPRWMACGYGGYPIADQEATYPIGDDGTNKSLTCPTVGNSFFRLVHP